MGYKFVFLTSEFYADYSHCPEIEQKPDRPHVRTLVHIENIDFAIPMRSHINHPHALLTNAVTKSGLDFSKAVIVTDASRYIDTQRKPHIRPWEFDVLRGKEHLVEQGMLRYLRAYRKALAHPDIPRNALLLKYSTLQYFPEYITDVSPQCLPSGNEQTGISF